MTKKIQETAKITTEELEKLKGLVGATNEVNNKRASLCLQKEIQIKRLNTEFDEAWEMLGLQSEKTQLEQREYLQQLDNSYGQNKSYDLSTGEIKDADSRVFEAKARLSEGFKTIKIRVHAFDVQTDHPRISGQMNCIRK